MLYKNYNVNIKKVDDKDAVIEAVFSTADKDRHGDIVEQSGWKLDEYKMNPVILFGHDHATPAIGKAIDIGVNKEGNLAGKIKFAIKENPLAKTIYDLFVGGYMRAFSVGYVNNKGETLKNDEGEEVSVHSDNTLYEISAVNVGANALALAKQKGINIEPLEIVENGENQAENEEAGADEPKEENTPPESEVKPELDDVKEEEESETEPKEEVEPENEETVEKTIEKEGRVLSKKNRQIVTTAVGALTKLLRADESADNKDIDERSKLPNRDGEAIKTLNKTIRVLVKNKSLIKGNKIKLKY